MKNLSYLILAFILVFSLESRSQSENQVREALMNSPKVNVEKSSEQFGTSVQEVYKADIFAEKKDYEKALTAFLKSRYLLKFRSTSGTHTANDVLVKEWSADSLNVSWRTEEVGDKVVLTFTATSKTGAPVAAVDASLRQQIRDFYLNYYNEIVAAMSKEEMTQKKDVSKAASLIGRIEKNIQTAEKTAEKERLAGDKAETLRQNLETKKESQQQELEKLETEKLEMVEQQQLIDAEISGKQLQHNELNREGNLETKEAQRVMKDLNKLKERSAKGKAEQIKKSEAIYKAKDAISKTTTEARELEDTKKEHISKEKSKRQEVDNLRSDLDKARKKKEEEEKEMTEVIKALEGIRKAQADFSLVQ
jgi:hypothetical protein